MILVDCNLFLTTPNCKHPKKIDMDMEHPSLNDVFPLENWVIFWAIAVLVFRESKMDC